MLKQYQSPALAIELINAEDILTLSNNTTKIADFGNEDSVSFENGLLWT